MQLEWLKTRKKKAPNNGIVVSVESTCPRGFRVCRQSSIDHWFCDVGYTLPCLSHDRAFDRRWAVESTDRTFGDALARDTDVRQCVERLGSLGCREIRTVPGGITASPFRRVWRRRDPAREAAARAQLTVLNGNLMRICSTRRFSPLSSWDRWKPAAPAVALLILPIVPVFPALRAMRHAADARELLTFMEHSLLWGVPLVLILLVVTAIRCARGSRAHKQFAGFAPAIIVFIPISVACAAVAANQYLDSGPVTEHRLLVLAVSARTSNEGEKWYAFVREWNAARGKRQLIDVTTEMATQLVAGESWLLISTSPGWLGVEWLPDVRIEPGEPAH